MKMNFKKSQKVPYQLKILPFYFFIGYNYLTKKGKIFWLINIILFVLLNIYLAKKYI